MDGDSLDMLIGAALDTQQARDLEQWEALKKLPLPPGFGARMDAGLKDLLEAADAPKNK